MLIQIEDGRAIRAAQNRLAGQLMDALDDQGMRQVGHRGGTPEVPIYAAGQGRLWFSPGIEPGNRYWNAFGVFQHAANQQVIAVEINVPVHGINPRVAGFFARETTSEHIYLMHDGHLGGGVRGVSRAAFLAYANPDLVEVRASDGRNREGIVVARLGDRLLVSDLWRFVRGVRDFREQVRHGGPPRERQEEAEAGELYGEEFAGWKTLPPRAATEYLTRHGEIVRALRNERRDALGARAQVFRTQLIDVVVRRGAEVTEVYEVKPRATRQDLYTALGQLLVHAPSDKTELILVIPRSDRLPKDVLDAIKRMRVRVRRFSFGRDGAVRFHDGERW